MRLSNEYAESARRACSRIKGMIESLTNTRLEAKAHSKSVITLPGMRDAIDQFRAAIQSAGLIPPDMIEADGKLHRFASNGTTKKCTEVGHRAIIVNERMPDLVAAEVGSAHDLAAVVDTGCAAIAAAKSAEVRHPAYAIQERSGSGNLNNAISGNSGHNAGPKAV